MTGLIPELNQASLFDVLEVNAVFQDGATIEQIRSSGRGRSITVHFSYPEVETGSDRVGTLIPLEQPGTFLWIAMVEGTVSQLYDQFILEPAYQRHYYAGIYRPVHSAVCFIPPQWLAFVDPVTGGYSSVRFQLEAQKKSALRRPALTCSSPSISINSRPSTTFSGGPGRYVCSNTSINFLIRYQSPGELVCRFFADQFYILAAAPPEGDPRL